MFRMSRAPLVFAFLSACALAQSADNPLSNVVKMQYDSVKNNLIRSAEKVPESDYNFKPTDVVRSFGQILGHVANSQYSYCSNVLGEANPNQGNNIEQKTSKADLVQAL